jgi:glycosyltransferase involved in cell wall biosynthesis
LKVSIITVVLNGAGTIKDTIKSVLSQDYPDIEYIVIDGGSTDETLRILADYQGKISKCVSGQDKGIYDAMNKGIKLSTGDIIAALNSNDIYADKSIVSQIVKHIQENNLDAAYGDLAYVYPENTGRIKRYWKAGTYQQGAFFKGWVPPHPTFFCRKQIFEKYGYFNDTFQIAADFELMLRFIEKHQIKVGYLPKVLVKMRTGGKANALMGILRGNHEILTSFRLNGFHLSPWFFIYKPIIKISQIFKRPKQ